MTPTIFSINNSALSVAFLTSTFVLNILVEECYLKLFLLLITLGGA